MADLPKRVLVKVPASTSNLGSGFDTLGLAVNLHYFVEAVETSEPGFTIDRQSTHYGSAAPLIQEAASAWIENLSRGVRIKSWGDLPVGRGLGASAALRVGVIAALSTFTGTQLSPQQLLDRAYALEGHPDNASPALFGGFTTSGVVNGTVRCLHCAVAPELRLITLIPSFEMDTQAARRLLPDSFSRVDTVHSLNRAALITAAFSSGNYAALRGVFDDVLHQPYRQKLLPQLDATIRAGERAGAIGGFLSGAGSAIICLSLHKHEEIAAAMQAVIPESSVRILQPENQGCSVQVTG